MNDGVGKDSRGPTTAERVRTVFARATAASLATGNGPLRMCRVHHLLPNGEVALSIGNENPIPATGSTDPVVLELLDHSAGASRDSVRAIVWVQGRTRATTSAETRPILNTIAATNPEPALLDVGHTDALVILTAESIVLADHSGAALVDLTRLLAAQPDPFSHVETAWVQHLEQHHRDMVERLRLRLPRGKRRGAIRLIGLDRYGLLVKTESHEDSRDHRIPFLTPATDAASLCRALKSLMTRPCARGLHPRC